MAKTNINVTTRTQKQQISKILTNQIVSGMKNYLRYGFERAHEIVEYKVATSRAFTNGCITGWNSENFSFTFEYGRRTKAVRISYINSDGMISAVFSEQQWIMMTEFIQNKLDRMIEEKEVEIAREKELEEQEKFERRVKMAVDKALTIRDLDQKLKEGKITFETWNKMMDDLND